MVKDCAPSHEIDKFEDILNLKGYENHNIGSKVTEILLNGWILPIGGVASGRVCTCRLRSRLVHTERVRE